MTQTIQLNRDQVAEWEPTVETPNRVSSLSVYAIPQAVELRRPASAGGFSITFEYPGHEKAGEVVPLDGGSPAVSVALSKFTQKVVELTVAATPSESVLKGVAERLLVAADDRVPLARRLSYAMSGAIIEKVMLSQKPQPLTV